MPVDSMLASIGLTLMSSHVSRTSVSFGSASSLDFAAVCFFPGMCAITKLNCNTKSHSFQNGGCIILVWKNLVTKLLSFTMMFGLVAPRKLSPNYFIAK